MKQNTKRFSSMIFALLLLVGALIVYFDLLVPAYGDLQNEKGQNVSEANLLQNEQQIVTQVQALVATYQTQTQGQQSVSRALPVGPDVAGALTQIYGIAGNDTVNIDQIGITNNEPQALSAAPVSNGSIGAAASGASIVKPLGSVSFALSASGSYEALKSFLSHIETNSRLMDVTTLAVHQSANLIAGKGALTQDFFTYTLAVTAYYQTP